MKDAVPRKHLRTSVIGLCAAVVVALALLQAVNLFSRYRETLHATEAHATDLSLILAEHMRNAVGAVDASLKQLVLHSARVGGPTAPADSWLPILRTAMAGMSHVRSMSVTDANGVIRHSTIPELIGQSRRDDVLFNRLSIDADAGIVADTPFRGTRTKTIVIPFGRRLQGPDGSFQGIVVASVTPDVFRGFYKSVDVGTDGVIWVLHPTGLAFLREPPAAGSDVNAPEAPAAIRAAIEGHDAGLQVAKIDSSGPTYVTAWHGLDQPPIVLAVSFSLPEALATWRRDAVLSIALTLLVGLALGAASLQLIRQLDARSAAERALAQREHELIEGQRVAGLAAARFILPDLVVYPSPQLAALFELPPDSAETTLDRLTERLIEPDRARFRESLDSCVAFGDRYQLEVRAKLAAGVERILWTEGVVENTLNTESKSILAIFQDVTEQRLAEERSNQSEQMAAIGRLTGGVAHDFNNLLTAIIGYTNLLQLRTDNEHPLRNYIEEIAKAGNRAASLTNQLLAFSRRQVLQPKVLNLNRIVAEMENLLQRLIGEDVELTTNLSPELGRVKADPGQIEQVLMNLVVSARDAMPQGGKLMIETANVVFDESYARTHLTIQPGRHVLLAVTDTGSGMDKQTLSHIFEPFFTTKPRGKGTGLGLSTAYGVVQQSGGNIWAYSEPGMGATFKIYLPCIEEYSAVAEPAALTIESLGGEETILLTEDEEAVRKLARKVLEDYGYRIIEAENAADALEMYRQYRGTIHLLVTDVVMPGLSGTELARRICDMDPLIKVLYMSGYTDDAIVHHGVLDAEFPFLQKPFTPDALAHKVREVLDERE